MIKFKFFGLLFVQVWKYGKCTPEAELFKTLFSDAHTEERGKFSQIDQTLNGPESDQFTKVFFSFLTDIRKIKF